MEEPVLYNRKPRLISAEDKNKTICVQYNLYREIDQQYEHYTVFRSLKLLVRARPLITNK